MNQSLQADDPADRAEIPSPSEDGPLQRGSCVVSIERLEPGSAALTQDTLAVEEPLEIQIAYGPMDRRILKPISITMRTPGHDKELAAGFLMTEGILADVDQIKDIRYGANSAATTQNVVTVALQAEAELRTTPLERNFYVTSSCGVCGKASLLALQSVCPPRRQNHFRIGEATLRALPQRLRKHQELFDRTGGLHAAALFDSAGKLYALREDVGRHNAVDKLIGGEWLADRVPLRERLLLLSGRASFELLQKAVMAGIPMVACVGAPSSLAVKVAHHFDVTLAGFLREQSFNLYHGAERVDRL